MKNLPVRRYSPTHYVLPCRNNSHGESKMVKKAVQGLVVISASYIGLNIIIGIFGLVWSTVSFILPLGVLSAGAYGGWQWLKNR